jgi:uncharacterized protein
MFKTFLAALLLLLGLASGPASHAAEPAKDTAIKPSFDCAAAKSKVKLLICGDPDLAALDVREAQMLRRARIKAVQPAAVNADEDVWLGERNSCSSAPCIARAYRRRIQDLRAWTD